MTLPICIDQVLPSYAKADAIGHEVSLLKDWLQGLGYVSDIYTELNPLPGRGLVDLARRPTANHLIVYHYSTGSMIPYVFAHKDRKCIQRFHNITPPEFFHPVFEREAYTSCMLGYAQAGLLRGWAKRHFTPSAYNQEQLDRLGMPGAAVIPCLRDYARLTRYPEDAHRILLLTQHYDNWLFVGRLVANKSAHELLVYLKLFKTHGVLPGKKPPRLILVGFGGGYYGDVVLPHVAEGLGLRVGYGWEAADACDVLCLSGLSDACLAQVYRSAKLFFCLSAHEGFCVPLAEALFFDLPIVTHVSTALPATCGPAALYMDPEDVLASLKVLQTALYDSAIRAALERAGKEYRERFTYKALLSAVSDFFSIERVTQDLI